MMKKYPDRYFDADEWKVIETGFDPDYSMVAESIFSLSNEYMGVRGYFDEGYSGNTLIGSYFNGVYEQQFLNEAKYKGVEDSTEFMVNALNWLSTKIVVDGETLDLYTSSFSDFKRKLDLKEGALYRSFIWNTKSGKKIKLEFERFVSMDDVHIGVQKIIMTSVNDNSEVYIHTGLDFSEEHEMYKRNFWQCKNHTITDNFISIEGQTISTKQKVVSCAKIYGDFESVEDIIEQKNVEKKLKFSLKENQKSEFVKLVFNYIGDCKVNTTDMTKTDYNLLKKRNILFWEEVWKKSDIEIIGDELNQQGIRFCIFQLNQTYHGAVEGANIGAKGLTGEAYNGNAFWDTEVYCLPFYVFNNIDAARNLLLFRYVTLEAAKERAKALDCDGAFYPIATIGGKECCNLWQHASLQLQASTAVAYGIWFYAKATGDIDFLHKYGIYMLIEISRMLATRGDFTENGKKYGYYGVMGPDEFQLMVNNNYYTNYMGKFVLDYTIETLASMKKSNKSLYDKVCKDREFDEGEIAKWQIISDKMYINYDKNTALYEQHEGYFRLPNVNINEIPTEEFPLYNNWSYDRLYRNNMLKQPDVLMIILMFNSEFSDEVLRNNYEFYEPKCIHESSLSPSVHSILATQLKKHKEAYKFFEFATRMDLDNYNRNTHEGLHTTSIAAAWMNIVYGFAGMRSDKKLLAFSPYLPKEWKGYSFRISYQESIVHIKVERDKTIFKVVEGDDIVMQVYDRSVTISHDPIEVTIPKEWRSEE